MYERGVPGVCASHLDDLRRWFSGLWFGFDQHPKEASVCLISAKLEHLPFFCFFFLSPRANWIPALLCLSFVCKNQSVTCSSEFGRVMLNVYPSHCMPIFNINQRYHAAWVPLGKALCDREKPQINLSLNWGGPTIFLLMIVIINIYKTPPDIPPAKTGEICILYCLCAKDSLKNSAEGKISAKFIYKIN